MHLTTPAGGLGCRPFMGGSSVAVYLLFYVPPIVYGGSVLVFVFVCVLWHVLLSGAIVLTRKRELVALL